MSSDPDRVGKRHSYRSLQQPDISYLDWVSPAPAARKRFVFTRVQGVSPDIQNPLVRFVVQESVQQAAMLWTCCGFVVD